MKGTEGASTAADTHVRAAESLWRRVLCFPLTRLVLALLFVAAAFIGRDVIANALLSLSRDAVVARAAVTILCVYGGYVLYVQLVERRPVRELDPREAPKELAVGIAIGGGMITVVVGTLWALGYYRVEALGPSSILLAALVTTGATALWEELVFRGILFRILEEGLGTWLALLISAGAFGMLHLSNENASIMAALTIAGVAGVLLAGVYVLTRRLWVAIGAHYAVNLTQGPIFGLPVSGRERAGILDGVLDGPEFVTGGAFGLEASPVAAVLGLAVAIYIVRRAYCQGRFVSAMWSQTRNVEGGGVLPELR